MSCTSVANGLYACSIFVPNMIGNIPGATALKTEVLKIGKKMLFKDIEISGNARVDISGENMSFSRSDGKDLSCAVSGDGFYCE